MINVIVMIKNDVSWKRRKDVAFKLLTDILYGTFFNVCGGRRHNAENTDLFNLIFWS